MASLSEVTDKGAFFCIKHAIQKDVTLEENRDNARGEIQMSHESENFESTAVRLLNRQSTQARYTVSYSYLLEAALDREWEKDRNGEYLSRKSSGMFMQEERRV